MQLLQCRLVNAVCACSGGTWHGQQGLQHDSLCQCMQPCHAYVLQSMLPTAAWACFATLDVTAMHGSHSHGLACSTAVFVLDCHGMRPRQHQHTGHCCPDDVWHCKAPNG